MTDSTSKPRGRPTKIEFAMVEKVKLLVVEGLSFEAIAAELGVSRRTLFEWLERGEAVDAPEGDELFVTFALAFRQAEAELERKTLGKIAASKPVQWQRFAWLLERRFPTRYGAKQRIEHTGAEGAPIQIDDARARLMALLDRHAPKGGAGSGSSEPQSS
ncbi:MAG: IS1 family transposase [Myxococcales bacterium]|nr:IS1 family transposase [Myxococcales bacterium]